MAGTGYIDTNGNRHIISGMITGELPKYTMAEYTALTNKPIDWICTDYDATSEYGINATEVKYDSNNSVKDMIDKANTVESVTGNSAFINGTSKTIQYVKFGKMVIVTGRFEITTQKPSGQSNYLFRGLPKPASQIVPVYDGSSDYLLLSQGDQNDGVLTSNGVLNTGNRNIMFCYSCQ